MDTGKARESVDTEQLKGAVKDGDADYKKAAESVDVDKAAESVDMDKVKEAMAQ